MYLGIFECKEDVFREFSALGEMQDCRVLFAWYNYEDYSGEAFVLFERDGKLYEVHGSHCSCYGLEGCWNPDEVSVEALNHYMKKGTFGYQDCGMYAKKLKGVLSRWKRKQKA